MRLSVSLSLSLSLSLLYSPLFSPACCDIGWTDTSDGRIHRMVGWMCVIPFVCSVVEEVPPVVVVVVVVVPPPPNPDCSKCQTTT